MTSGRAVFLDTNILIRANVSETPLHREALGAVRKLRSDGDMLWISRQILREYTAVLTRPQGFMNPVPASVIVESLHYFQSRFLVADDTALVTERLLELLLTVPVGGKQVHDMNIVATMQVYGITHLLTLNTQDFTRFSSYITLLSLSDLAGGSEEE